MSVDVRIEGLRQLDRNMDALSGRILNALKDGVYDNILDLQGKSQELAPLDTGDLRGSAKTDIRVISAKKVEGKVSFNEPYALEQHENMSYPHPRGGQAKYLEQPLNENERTYIEHVKDKVKQVIR